MANSVITKVTGTDSSTNRIGSTFYGTCTTAAATASKAVTLSDSCVFTDSCLVTGVTIHVKFTNSNTHATPTLKVGSATAKQIMSRGTTKAGTTPETSWYAGAVVSFTYDGTYWQMNDHIDAVDEKVKQTPYPTTASVDPETDYYPTPVLLGKPFDTTYTANTSDAYAAKGLQYSPGSLYISNEYDAGDWDHTTVDSNQTWGEMQIGLKRSDSDDNFVAAANMNAGIGSDGGHATFDASSIYESSTTTYFGDALLESDFGNAMMQLLGQADIQNQVVKTASVSLHANPDESTNEIMDLYVYGSDANTSANSTVLSCVLNNTTNQIDLGDCLIADEIDRGGVQLTQAEYDALVQAGTVDADTTYFITDRNNAGATYAAGIAYNNTASGLDSTNVQGAIDEIVTGGNYSTTQEQRVGTWIDGNPLYRIVMKISTSVTSWTVIGSIAIQEDHIAFADYYCKAPSSSGYTFAQSYYTGSHDMFRAALQWNNTNKNYQLFAQLGTSYPAKPAEVIAIIYYTKTTS